ncbi:Gfo/Idh/MocA family oxidoreductase [Roseomonas alkaliterrae]|uniref:Putative dehydrogenase n=2 Tax=Neoroseomonas alkaliterrae TaxID=1452450 RepID=A0A840XHJ7_9PROT|nr:Gfo/Idh/MocA family oxidoreductase [Neoroseomonas alkaliterrae]MBB5687928.1 putative dehydrogenase [Neoroseomonas alkaliterrae]MBR0676951.1 Gfo/Idh/MocA family oxidoreductase [Neoroseomonas alkaliterrae]
MTRAPRRRPLARMAMPRILLIGCGAFGRVHAAALRRLEAPAQAFDPDAAAAEATGLPIAPTLAEGLAACDAAIVATPVPTHVPLASTVLAAGCDLFLEKPATETAAEAAALASLAERGGRIAQVGLYFRFHPKAVALRRMVAAGEFGHLHYLAARFSGLKRARGDSGALLNDAVHFADLLPWIAGEAPARVFATLADPLGRGREDLAVIQMMFPSGLTALIEAGCVLPGRWPDAVVPGAETRKEIVVAGRAALAEVDFAAETFALRRGAHEPAEQGAWLPRHGPREDPGIAAADPVTVVAAELAAFIEAVRDRRPPEAGLRTGALAPARILDAARRSALEGRVVALEEIA